MDSRGCALVILVLILAVLAWGILTAGPESPISFPEITWPSFRKILPTLGTAQVFLPTQASTLPPTLPSHPTSIPFPTPEPPEPRNGRLLFVGFDGSIWSAELETSSAARLGTMSEGILLPNNPWYSPDGRHALVARSEGDQQVAYLVRTDGKIPELRLGTFGTSAGFRGQHELFAFANDSQRFFFIDTSVNPTNLLMVELEDFKSFSWPVQASNEEVTFAAFLGSSHRLVVKSFDPNINAHFLELFEVGQTLTAPRRLLSRDGYQIVQFAAAPTAAHIAVVFRRFGEIENDELFIYNLNTGAMTAISPEGSGRRILLPSAAWSPDGKFLLFSEWQAAPEGINFRFRSYDSVMAATQTLIEKSNVPAYGNPFCYVFSFAPDGFGAAVRMYEDAPDEISAAIVLMDGSYNKEISRVSLKDGVPVGLFAAGFAPDWTRAVMIELQAGSQFGELFATTLDGSQKELLENRVPYEFLELGPVISPDGEWVAFTHFEEESETPVLSIIRMDGSERRDLFKGTTALLPGLAPAGLPLVWLGTP